MGGGVAVPLPGGLYFASDLKLDSCCAHLCDEDTCLCMYVCPLIRQVSRNLGQGITTKMPGSHRVGGKKEEDIE